MEKAKISSYQFFVLLFLFEMGSALIIPLGIEAKQDAWLAILLGMLGGLLLFLVYYLLYQYYPDIPLTEYLQKTAGKVLGWIIALLYLLYFAYIAARVLRDFGTMLVTFAYPDTPLFIINALLIIVLTYAVKSGIESVARTGELLFVLMYLLAIAGFILIVISGLIDINNLKPLLEEGTWPVVKTAFTQTLYVPFGEAVVFAMILPYLSNPKKARMTGVSALCLSGINLAIVMAVNISVLGIDYTMRSQYPLLSAIQRIQVAEFLERLDVFYMLGTVIGGFFKICIFFYAVVIGASGLFNVKKPSRLAYPIGLVILILSMTIASSYSEHIREGLDIVPIYLHLPFQVIIPIFLLAIAFVKNRKKQTKKDPNISEPDSPVIE
ncbi:spore germination protein KB [Bacillus oleivorans]|uniref:Spore germination protein KB n=1 Tax=Bacillus oleivorans TaxID=1448271 RepID=A0A285D575_9BACI|nr:GerAB/ArcD/ProY family transporter [Bacillus oleivorans]SNX74438.1 spore germination protein KB [Bacillus oleivorans]